MLPMSQLAQRRTSYSGYPLGQPRYVKIALEPLEDRSVPTTVPIVDNPALDSVPNTHLNPVWSFQLQQATTLAPSARVVFAGDSILYRFQHQWGVQVWNTQIAPFSVKNIAIEGNTTAQILWQIEKGLLSEVEPEVIVLMIGVNNLNNLQGPEQTAEGVRATVDAFQETEPQADILLLSILPTHAYYPSFNSQVDATNELISNQHDGDRVHYLDLTAYFRTVDGNANPYLLLDPLHPNVMGYAVLSSVIQPSLNHLLASPSYAINSLPLMGDWDGDGIDGIALVNTATASWYLRNDTSSGGPEHSFEYGLPGWIPLAGDWDGDGDDDIGTFDPTRGRWYLRNSALTGAPDAMFDYGLPFWLPVTGDWDGDGRDSVGVFDPNTTLWFLRNDLAEGTPNEVFQYGLPGLFLVTGDWNSDGRDEVGVIHPAWMIWYLRPSDLEEEPDTFAYGGVGWRTILGDWDGDGGDSAAVMDTQGCWSLRDPERDPFCYRLYFLKKSNIQRIGILASV